MRKREGAGSSVRPGEADAAFEQDNTGGTTRTASTAARRIDSTTMRSLPTRLTLLEEFTTSFYLNRVS